MRAVERFASAAHAPATALCDVACASATPREVSAACSLWRHAVVSVVRVACFVKRTLSCASTSTLAAAHCAASSAAASLPTA